MKNVSLVFTFLIFAFFSTNSFAAIDGPVSSNPVDLVKGQSTNVFVHISAIKKTSKGLTAQIDGFSATPGKDGAQTLKARLEIKGNRLLVQLHSKNPKVAQLTMPAGYQLPKEIASKLGANKSVVMSGGSTMVKQETKSMLWFEIQ